MTLLYPYYTTLFYVLQGYYLLYFTFFPCLFCESFLKRPQYLLANPSQICYNIHMKRALPWRQIFEIALLTIGVTAVTIAFFLQSEEKNYLSLAASVLGVVAIFLVAKGVIVGQYLSLAFALLYAVLSYFAAYYGECILVAVTMLPSSVFSIITWTKNPSKERGKVKVNNLSGREFLFLTLATLLITVGVYFLLRALHTEEVFISAVSFVTSIFAAYLLVRRSPFYALAYLLNDVVLIALWSLACLRGEPVLPNVICFCVFLLNDT